MPASLTRRRRSRAWLSQKPSTGFGLNPASPLARGLVGYWLLNEAAGSVANDLSGNGYAGTLTNSPTWVSGKTGPALSFNGSSNYVDVGDKAALKFTSGDFSLSCLIQTPSSFPSNSSPIGKASPNAISPYGLWFSSSSLRFLIGATASTWAETSAPAATLATSTWYAVVATKAGTTTSLYVNGTRQAVSTIASSTILDDVTPFRIGCGSAGAFNSNNIYYPGVVEWGAVHNRALSGAEIAAWYADPYSMVLAPPARRSFPVGAGTGGPVNGSATLADVSTLTAAGSVSVNGSGSLACVSGLTASGTVNVNGSATLADVSTLTAAGTVTEQGAATLACVATLTGAGTVAVNGSAALACVSTLTAAGTVSGQGAAALACVSTLSAAGTVAERGAAALACVATLTAAGTVAGAGAASLGCVSALAAAGSVSVNGSGSLACVSGLTASGTASGGIAPQATYSYRRRRAG